MSSDGATTSASTTTSSTSQYNFDTIVFTTYEGEHQLDEMRALVNKDLSEPYSVYTYRYFLNTWPHLCLLAIDTSAENKIIGVIVNKKEVHRNRTQRGYIGMLAVAESYRHRGIASKLVCCAIDVMRELGCDEVVLETELTNRKAMALYLKLGFVKDKRLTRYYFSGNDAFRLKLWLT
jgi:peptide alpha-N-acetyltransferase